MCWLSKAFKGLTRNVGSCLWLSRVFKEMSWAVKGFTLLSIAAWGCKGLGKTLPVKGGQGL